MTTITFNPPLTCSTYDCGKPSTVATVEAAPPQLGEFMEYPPVGPIYIFMPLCRDCVAKMAKNYGVTK